MPLAVRCYDKVGLPTNPSKSFINATDARFWGAEVDGKAGIVRPNSFRLWPLVLITMRVCCLGVVSVGLLESLSGSWIAIFLFRRRCLAAMNEIFDVLHAGLCASDVVRLSDTLKDELFVLAVLGTLSYVNLRAVTLDAFKETDASDWGMACVSAKVPYNVSREVMRYSLTRSLWSRLLPPGKAWMKQKGTLDFEDELPGDEFYDVHPLWEVLARSLHFREEWRRPHQRQVHINIAELQAHLVEEEKLCQRHQSFRCLYGLDSQVSLGALVKGRSSSKSLNRLLTRSLPVIIGADGYGAYGFLPSALNRADDPTRDREVSPPDWQLPPWWDSLSAGDSSAFDEWMQELAQKHPNMQETHDFSSLGFKEDLPLKTGKQMKAASHFGKPCRSSAAPFDPVSEKRGKICTEMPVDTSVGLGAEARALIMKLDQRGQVWWRDPADKTLMGPGYLDLFTGKGGVAKQLLRNGCPFVISYEWLHSPSENLLHEDVREDVLQLIRLGAVAACGSALICKSFSRAVTPPIRNQQFLRGVPWMGKSYKQSVREGNSHADFERLVIETCEETGIIWWLENPDGSFLWCQRWYRPRFGSADSLEVLRVDFCRFGTPWRKRTRVATNCPGLAGLRMMCRCAEKGKEHIQLRGMHPTLRKPWTAVAEAYPRGFCSLLAGALSSNIGWSRKLNIAGCSKTGSLRVGEAANPGSRMTRRQREISLEMRPQQLHASVALGEKCWKTFHEWTSTVIVCKEPLQLFLEVPLFLAHALRRYGDLLFSSGGALLYYRHLVLAAQLRVPNLRQYVHVCWELAGRWELAEPVVHRVPLPMPIAKALVALAWNLQWRRWAGVVLICFYGIARVGEVLQCKRKHLLLPDDLLVSSQSHAAFVVLESSKTSRRRGPRVQHLKISEPMVVWLLTKIYGCLQREDFLFGATPSAFRSRWDYLLSLLGVPRQSLLTPGGLRGGGAVEAYRTGTGISEIQWRMRLKQQSTLESYLQEVAAMSALTDLPEPSRKSIQACASLFLHLR